MSIGKSIVTPTPTAAPFTAAITGFRLSKIRKVTMPAPSRRTSSDCEPCAAPRPNPPLPERSAPAQNARPAPVTITAPTSSSASVASNAARRSSII